MLHSATFDNTINQIDDYNIYKPDLVKTIRESKEYRHTKAIKLNEYRKRHNECHRVLRELCNETV